MSAERGLRTFVSEHSPLYRRIPRLTQRIPIAFAKLKQNDRHCTLSLYASSLQRFETAIY